MTTLAIIGFITILLFAAMTAYFTILMGYASMWDSVLSVVALFFGIITIGALVLAWHLSPFTIVMKTI